ncbi:MAG: sodium:alanine symporter family protein [Elusimicrobia bacterium]|nr:sodium:alanine symporter family protein [Elusimicrobiota bacterium]
MENIITIIERLINAYNSYIGTYLLMAVLIPTGIYFTIRLKFLQTSQFVHSLKIISGKYDDPNETGDISHFRALATALSATIGTGNIAGVALAIYWGGPGAIFWMWLTGFLGMINKYVECALGLKYRKVHPDGSVSGGPMYYMADGLKNKLGVSAGIMAGIFAIGTVICSLGTGNMAQSNSMSDALNTSYGISPIISGLVVSTLVFLVIVGGIKRIANVTSKLVPFMAVFYVVSAIIVLLLNFAKIPAAFAMIFQDAFTGTAATGGFIGSTFFLTARFGIARGLFSNEAGQGSASIAHAAAKTKYPAREGLVASVGPFIDTLIICTLTALVVVVTGAWSSGLKGVSMTTEAFSIGLAPIGLSVIGSHIVAVGLLLFALSTAISWSYYGDRAMGYLFGKKAIKPYRLVYCGFCFLGAIWGIDLVWSACDMVITFMAIPNLIAMLLLSGVIVKETKDYFDKKKDGFSP